MPFIIVFFIVATLVSIGIVAIVYLIADDPKSQTARGIAILTLVASIFLIGWMIAACNERLEKDLEVVATPSTIVQPNGVSFKLIAFADRYGVVHNENLNEYFKGTVPENARIRVTFWKTTYIGMNFAEMKSCQPTLTIIKE